ncbi:MAG: ATP-binding protein [Actinomycetota bacterium]|nr:ATP-binding protein [Actinomycetota bacterium]
MILTTLTALQRLIENRIPEGPSLEYKSAFPPGKKQRVELLKDITGMGNGGGGTLIYGVSEGPGEDGVPDAIVPLEDRGAVGAIEDLARSGVRPPLLMELAVIEVEGGFLMVVDVERSSLGPYMIQLRNEKRYYKRVGSRTNPMDEQEVRDAYALAARAVESQRERWDVHGLPIPVPPKAPWLSIAAVPRVPAHDIFDPKEYPNPDRHLGSGDISSLLPYANWTQLAEFDARLGVWSGGVHAEIVSRNRIPCGLLRLHRDGSVGIAVNIEEQKTVWQIAYHLNVYLLHVGRVWRQIGLRGPVELQVHVRNLGELTLFDDLTQPETVKTLRAPPLAHHPEVHLIEEVPADDLITPRTRHRILRLFADRMEQAFGQAGDDGHRFDWGWLYRPGQNFLGISLDGGALWDERGAEVGIVDELGCIWTNRGELVAHLDQGLVIDRKGFALCATELCPSPGLPDDFFPHEIDGSIPPRAHESSPLRPRRHDSAKGPAPTREWSTDDIWPILGQARPWVAT